MRNQHVGTGKTIDGDREEQATSEAVSQMVAQQAAPGILLNGMVVTGTEVVQGERFSIYLEGDGRFYRLDVQSAFQLVDLQSKSDNVIEGKGIDRELE